MKRFLTFLILCCALVLAAKDYIIPSGGGEVAALALDAPAEINSLMLKTSAMVSRVQYWDSKTLKLVNADCRISRISGGYAVKFTVPVKSTAIVLHGKNLKAGKITAAAVVTAGGTRELKVNTVPAGKKLVPDWNREIATVLPNMIIFPGKEKRKHLTLASPNRLNRKDCGVIRLNLIDYIGRENVKSASLTVVIVPWQAAYPRMVEVGLLNEEQDAITVDTGFGHSVKNVASLMLPFGPRIGSFTVTLDITGEVNAALNKGISSLTWRFKDMHCVQQGNLRKRAYAISIPAKSVFFTIAE